MAIIEYREELKRKLIHLSSLWMCAAVLLLPGRYTAAGLFLLLGAVTVLIERAFIIGIPVITPLYRRLFGAMLRKDPRPDDWLVSGGAPVFFAGAVVALCFSPRVAAAALAILLTADAAAALIGRRFCRHRINGKSWEGTIAFFMTALIVAWGVFIITGATVDMFPRIPVAALAAALAELYQKQLKMDDNFLIPLVSGFVLEYLQLF